MNKESKIKEQVPSIKSAERVLELLELLSRNQATGIGMEVIVKELGIPRSSFYALIRMLIQRGYVEKPSEGIFKLGVKTFEIGSAYLSNIELTEIAQPIMQEMKNLTKETVNLTIFDRERLEVIVVTRAIGINPLRFDSSLGSRLPAHKTASGKLFLSEYNHEEIQNLYRDVAEQEVISHLNLELDQVRQKGYSENNQETYPGVLVLAAPIVDYSQKIAAACNIGIPVLQSKQFDKRPYTTLLMTAASQISYLIGGKKQPTITELSELSIFFGNTDKKNTF